MIATELPRTFQTALALFEGLRRLGFSAEDIFFEFGRSDFVVSIQQDGKKFGIRAGSCDFTYEEWEREWSKVLIAMNDGSMTEKSLKECWESSAICHNGVKLVSDLLLGGVRLPCVPKEVSSL